ncbi:MAG: pyruvate kinase [Chloroflexi bacterium]|nr:pyruvate kinase [Chloroflexota bacterium]
MQTRPSQRQAKIVATVGPATSSAEMLEALLRAGVDVFRLNFSHGTPEEHTQVVRSIREVSQRCGRVPAVLADLQGPRIRTGALAQGPIHLRAGQPFTVTTRSLLGDAAAVSTDYAGLPSAAQPGQRLLLDDGNLELRVESVSTTDILCVVTVGGPLGEHKGVILPGAALDLPPLTEKDQGDLTLGLDLGVDYIALSFVQQASDAELVRKVLRARDAHVPVIAKIERLEALQNLDTILRAFDGVMVARGDLGVEVAPEEVPVWQKRIIRRANEAGKLVITATQMLESMVVKPRPTRAEASDVANAVWDGTDAVMLSAETAVGAHPQETVDTMARIIHQAEAPGWFQPAWEARPSSHSEAVCHAACHLTRELEVAALVVLTTSGRTAHLISKARPNTPILAITDDPAVCRQLALWWGVQPYLLPFRRSTEEMIAATEEFLMERGAVSPGDTIVLVGSTPVAARGRTNFVKVHHVRQGRR